MSPFAEQFVGAHGVQNRARVDLGRDLEGDTRGDVRFDDAGDDVDAGTLRGDDAMNAGGAGHLGDARDGHFDVGGATSIRSANLIDDDDDVTELLGNDDILVARHDDFLIQLDRETFSSWLDLLLLARQRQLGFRQATGLFLGRSLNDLMLRTPTLAKIW